jgi:hypothetical protein
MRAAVFVASGFNLDQRLADVYVVENTDCPNTQLLFCEPMGTQSLAVARGLIGLLRELTLDTSHDLRLVIPTERLQVRESFGRELDPEHDVPNRTAASRPRPPARNTALPEQRQITNESRPHRCVASRTR